MFFAGRPCPSDAVSKQCMRLSCCNINLVYSIMLLPGVYCVHCTTQKQSYQQAVQTHPSIVVPFLCKGQLLPASFSTCQLGSSHPHSVIASLGQVNLDHLLCTFRIVGHASIVVAHWSFLQQDTAAAHRSILLVQCTPSLRDLVT